MISQKRLHAMKQLMQTWMLVLQLYDGEKPLEMVDGWNAWFFRDLNNLSKVFPSWKKNNHSLGQLWTGFLRFYTEEFDFRNCVVSIRRIEPLSRFEKLWTSNHNIAIEDPFDLKHNLGVGLTSRMSIFIQKMLQKARSHFCQPVMELPTQYPTASDYWSDLELFRASSPPTDRNCRQCGKIGHWRRECPELGGHERQKTVSRDAERHTTAGKSLEREKPEQNHNRKRRDGEERERTQTGHENHNGVKTQPQNAREAGKKSAQKWASPLTAVNRSKSAEGKEQVREEKRKPSQVSQQTKTSRSETSQSSKHRVRHRAASASLLPLARLLSTYLLLFFVDGVLQQPHGSRKSETASRDARCCKPSGACRSCRWHVPVATCHVPKSGRRSE